MVADCFQPDDVWEGENADQIEQGPGVLGKTVLFDPAQGVQIVPVRSLDRV
jgi:hypothetical protein